MSDITKLLEGFDKCDAIASDELLSLLYGELRRIAAEKMWREGAGRATAPDSASPSASWPWKPTEDTFTSRAK